MDGARDGRLGWAVPKGESTEGATYNPRSDTWRPVPPAPIPGRMLHTAAWVGGEMVVFGGVDETWWGGGIDVHHTTGAGAPMIAVFGDDDRAVSSAAKKA